MASGWKRFTGSSQYPELTTNNDGSAFTYGTKKNRNYRIGWLQGRRNEEAEREMMVWITRTTGEHLPSDPDDILDALYDGKILCRFLERLNPNALRRPVIDKQALFCATENITNFLDSLKNFGLTDEDLFTPSDVLEKKDLNGLIATLKKLRDVVN